jgi:hypothetical protein
MTPADYQIRVAGPIGPVVGSSLPELTISVLPVTTVFTGTVTDTTEILAVLDVLAAHGLTPIDTLITPVAAAQRDVSDSADGQPPFRPEPPRPTGDHHDR